MASPLSASSAKTLKAKLVSQAIQDPLFKSALSDAAFEINKLSLKAANEATVESAFERVLYGVLKDVGIPFHPDKEIPVQTRRHTAKGRTDSRIGAVIIEYKQPSTLKSVSDIDKATKQLTEYVISISKDMENEVVGFLTDGTKILELRATEGVAVSTSSLASLDSTTLIRLVRSIISLDRSALSARNLIRDFCGTSYDGIVFRVAHVLNDILAKHATIKTEMLRTEWEALFRLAHEDQSQQKRIQERRQILGDIFEVEIIEATMEYRALFALHTAYAIILKLIAFRVVSDVKFHTTIQDYKSITTSSSAVMRAFCATLEDGELFRQIGILNLLEGDFFSWYADTKQWNNEISKSLKEILNTLARYEDVKTVFDKNKAVDLFRSLYEATVPQIVRGSFGEFYTPYWLAEHVLESSRLKPNWTALDPCCGSGTFLIAAVSKIRTQMAESEPVKVAHSVLERVFGIDLNPLAVLTARIHYFIHIADLLEDDNSEIVIPVFLGDASNVPVVVEIEEAKLLHYELKTLKTPLTVYVPVALAQDYRKFARIMFEFEKLVQAKSYKEAKSYFLDEAKLSSQPKAVQDHLEKLADDLIGLERKEWNGIWARIIANFITTACIGPFTNIIGNPPWIDWKTLPAGYRDKVKALCVDRGLFSGAGRTGGINLNVCALITHVAATNWLKEGGHLAFLMPRELANQASYEGWRRSVGGVDCSLVEFHDWSKAGHPFDPVKEDFMTFVFQRKSRDQINLPVHVYKKTSPRAKAHHWSHIEEANEHLSRSSKVAGQIIEGSTSYTIAENAQELHQFKQIAGACAYVGREGIEFYPQELMLFKYIEPGPETKEGKSTAWLSNIQVSKSKYKIPQQKVLLETEFLFPLVKGPFIETYEYNDPNILVAFPYDEKNPHAPISKARLAKESKLLLAYFNKWKSVLEQQTHYSDTLRGEGEFYGVARTGPYSFRSCYVAFRDNTNWCASVLATKKMPWGENKRFVFQNHAVSMCERIDGQIISEVEAYFIAGIFNTPIVGDFIQSSSDNRSFKIRPPVHVPLYDAKNLHHKEIARLSKLAAQKPLERAKHLTDLQTEYLVMCSKRNS